LKKKDLLDYIPFAIIQDYFYNRNYFQITSKGDFLNQFTVNLDVLIVQILSPERNFKIKRLKEISFKKHYEIFYKGFTEDLIESYKFNFIPIKIKEKIKRKNSYIIFFESNNPIPDDIIGSWLCIKKESIKQKGELFFFDIKGKMVKDEFHRPIGNIIDYLETGAHGILIIELDDKKQIFVPFIQEYCEIFYKKENSNEVDYIQVKNWEYFLET
jgi:ribosomal 30S subunit maturation factor RimM